MQEVNHLLKVFIFLILAQVIPHKLQTQTASATGSGPLGPGAGPWVPSVPRGYKHQCSLLPGQPPRQKPKPLPKSCEPLSFVQLCLGPAVCPGPVLSFSGPVSHQPTKKDGLRKHQGLTFLGAGDKDKAFAYSRDTSSQHPLRLGWMPEEALGPRDTEGQ